MTEKEEEQKPVNNGENGEGDLQPGLFQVLDEMAGIDRISEAEALEQLRTATPEPLTPGFIDKVIASLPPPDCHPKESPPPRRFWRRPAALIPIALAVALAAATPFAVVWLGLSSENLTYEDAQDIVFEEWHDVEYRLSALGRLSSEVWKGVQTIEDCAGSSGSLAVEARETLQLLLGLVTGDGPDVEVTPFRPGHYQEVLSRLQQKDLTEEEKLQAMSKLLLAMQAGIAAIRRCKGLGPPLDFSANIAFSNLERKIREGMRTRGAR